MKKTMFFAMLLFMSNLFLHSTFAQTKSGPISVCYVETNSVNLANVAAYSLKKSGAPLFDIGVVFGPNIKWDSTYNRPGLVFKSKQQAVLDNWNTVVKPLQDRGIKVMFDVLADHDGVGICNFTSMADIQFFAKQCADTVNKYGFDGVDFDDEWAEYGTRGHPGVNDSSFVLLIKELRTLLPNKLITFYALGPAYSKQTWNGLRVGDYVNYTWNAGYYGWFSPNVPPLTNINKSGAAIWVSTTPVSTATSEAQQTISGGYGLCMFYDIHNYDESSYLTNVSKILYNDTTVLTGTLQSWPLNNTKPVVSFTGSPTSITTGQTVNFSNSTTNAVSYNWTFSGGVPSTSTAVNPSVVYNTAGTYAVKLVATNSYGTDSLIRSGYITVTTPVPGGNYSLSFNGSNQYVNAGTINLSGSALTMEGWVKVNQFKTASPYISTVMGIEESQSNTALLRFGDAGIPANKLQFVLSNGTTQIKLTSKSSFNTATWYHIAATYDGAAMKLFINGQLDTSIALSGNFVSNGAFQIAKSWTDNVRFINGKMDELKVWKRALTQSEIQSGMCGVNPLSTSLEAYWKLNDGGTIALDTTGHAHTGTLVSMTAANWSTDVNTTCNIAKPVAGFNATSTTIGVGQAVTFTNSSTNATTYNWTFTGGTPSSSTVANPGAVTYTAAGIYTVKLVVTNAAGSDSLVRTGYITVVAPPVASFIANITEVTTAQSVTFSNGSTNATSYSWTFTGGTPSTSSIASPTVTYNVPGVYTVKLVATNIAGSDSMIRTNYIIVTNPVATNYSLTFNGTNQYVNTGNITLSGSAITMEGWIKANAFKTTFPYISTIMGTEATGNAALLRMGDAGITAGNKLQFVLYIGTQQAKLISNTVFATNTWYHVAATYDGATMRIYVNGVLDASLAQTGSFVSNGVFNIGYSFDNNRYWNGKMDELRVWKRALTQAEIQANMCTVPVSSTLLEGYWKMNEGIGTSTADTTGHLHTGIMMNMTAASWSTDVSSTCGGVAARNSISANVNNTNRNSLVKVWPNPIIKGNTIFVGQNKLSANAVLSVFSLNGNVVIKRTLIGKINELSTSTLSAGVYYYSVRSSSGQLIDKGSFIVQ